MNEMATDDSPDKSTYPFTSFNFLVSLTLADPTKLGVLTPLCNGEFTECDGLEMTVEPKTVREGGNNTRQIHLVGPVTYGNLTLKRGMTRNQDLWKWFNAAVASPAAPSGQRGLLAGAEIVMADSSSQGSVRYQLYDCLPIKLKASPLHAKDGLVAIEEMQIAYSYFTIKLA
jgi:phage tail-like protein